MLLKSVFRKGTNLVIQQLIWDGRDILRQTEGASNIMWKSVDVVAAMNTLQLLIWVKFRLKTSLSTLRLCYVLYGQQIRIVYYPKL